MFPLTLTQSPFVSRPSRRTPKYEQNVNAFSIGRALREKDGSGPVGQTHPWVRRFAGNARGLSPARSTLVAGCSLPCGASMLRVLAPHQSASAQAALRAGWGLTPWVRPQPLTKQPGG